MCAAGLAAECTLGSHIFSMSRFWPTLQHASHVPDTVSVAHIEVEQLKILDGEQVLVLDEADRLLDAGYGKHLEALMRRLPKQRRTGVAFLRNSRSPLSRVSRPPGTDMQGLQLALIGACTCMPWQQHRTMVALRCVN